MTDTPAPIATPAEIERLKERLRSAEATVDTFMRAQEHYREAMDERNTFKNAARAAEAQVAALTEQVRKLREALEDQPEAGDDDFYQLGWRHAMERCRAALSPTEPEAELAVMKAAAASLNASVVAGSALMAEENLDRQELKQRARAAEASALTARRDALEEAAKVLDIRASSAAAGRDSADRVGMTTLAACYARSLVDLTAAAAALRYRQPGHPHAEILEMSLHGVYVGTKHPELKGKGALLQDVGTGYTAQFDDLSLKPWCFGWHPFGRDDFQIDRSAK